MSYVLRKLRTKEEIDDAIINTIDKVVVLRFGKEKDLVCMEEDDILSKAEPLLRKMAEIFIVEITDVPFYCQYFDISIIPSTIFFFNCHHMKIESGMPDHTKWIGSFVTKQDFIDLVETIYRGAFYGKVMITSPISPEHTPKYELLYKDL